MCMRRVLVGGATTPTQSRPHLSCREFHASFISVGHSWKDLWAGHGSLDMGRPSPFRASTSGADTSTAESQGLVLEALVCPAGACMEKWTPENAVGRLQAELSGVEAKVEVSWAVGGVSVPGAQK